jgi:uncharacterized membrane protein YgdD (TMEM256/DUF423 family)
MGSFTSLEGCAMSAGAWAFWNIGLACVLGGAGVALAAVAAHRVADPSLTTAAMFLILHGAAAIGLSAVAGGSPQPTSFLISASVMLVAVTLFSGDVAARVLLGDRLFPMAAPIGGSLLILSWLAAGASGVIAAIKSG